MENKMCIKCLLDVIHTLHILNPFKISPKIYIILPIYHMKKHIVIGVKQLAQGDRSRGLGCM